MPSHNSCWQISTPPSTRPKQAEARVVVLTHTAPVFCAGADLKERASGKVDSTSYVRAIERLGTIAAPVIAAVDGPVRAGGLGVMAACDLVVVNTSITFALTEVRIGVAPAIVSAPLLQRCNWSKLAAPFLTGEMFDAVRALEMGLVTHVTDDVAATVDELSRDILLGGPKAVAATKRLLRSTHTMARAAGALGVAVHQRGRCRGHGRVRREAIAAVGHVTIVPDRVLPDSETFRANRDAMLAQLRQHDEQLALVNGGGGEKYVERHRQRGKLLARERDRAAPRPRRRRSSSCRRSPPGAPTSRSAPGVVTGIGVVEGVECVIIANDPTVRGGTSNPMTVRKNAARDARSHGRTACRSSTSSSPAAPTCRPRARSSSPAGRPSATSPSCRRPASRRSRSCSATPPPAAPTCRA